MELAHTALWVADLEATLAFYVDALGLERTWSFTGDDGVENVYVGTPDGAEIQFKHDPDESAPVPAGVDHVGMYVDDVDDCFEHVRAETGCPVVLEPTTMDDIDCRVAFVSDPDGYDVELVERL